MKKITKNVVCGLIILSFLILNVDTVSAASTIPRIGQETDQTYGTIGVLSVNTSLKVDTPIATTCSVISKGTSNAAFGSHGTGYERKLVGHTLDVNIGGIGSASVSADGLSLVSGNKEHVYSCNTFNLSYSISTGIWRLLTYSEAHCVQYNLQKNGKKKCTVIISTAIRY